MTTREAHTRETALEPGVYPQAEDRYEHFSLVGRNARQLVVLDATGLIDFGGVEVVDPDHLHTFADRLHHIADVLAANLASRAPAPAGAGLCERCAHWEADPARHPNCPTCGRPWSQIVATEL